MAQWNKIITSGSDAELNSLSSSLLNVGTQGSSYSFPTSSGEVAQVLIMNDGNQLSFADTADNLPVGTLSSSLQIENYNKFATTGSNTFVGDQTITGSIVVSGSNEISLSSAGGVVLESENITIRGTETIDGYGNTNLVISGTLFATSNTVLRGIIIVGDNLVDEYTGDPDLIDFNARVNTAFIPSGSGEYDLGSGSNEWRDIYAQNLYATASLATTASLALQAESASTAELATTASYIQAANIDGEITASTVEFDNITNKPVLYSGSSQLVDALDGQDLTLNVVSASIYHEIYTTQSINLGSGSFQFGDTLDDTHTFTGSVDITGSLTVIGNIDSVGRINTDDSMRSVFVGRGAGEKESPGFLYNTGIGYVALGEISSGNNNTALGFQSLGFTTTGADNIGIGYFAGLGILGGVQNIFIGTEAGGGNYSEGGSREANVGIGHNALRLTSTANNNTAVGTLAGRNITTGGLNAFFGWRAGGSATTGISNVALGANAGWANMDGDNNILIGYNTATSASSDNNTIVIGTSEVGRGSNTTTIGNDNITSTKIYGSLEIDGITDVSASIASLEDFSSSLDSTFATNSDLQNLIDKTGSYATTGSNTFTGNQTINASTLEIDNTGDAQIVLDRGANSNDAEIVFQTNNTFDWTIGTGQIGGDADFTIRHQNNNNIFRLSGTGLNINTSVSASEFSGSFVGDGSGLTGVTANGTLSSSAQIATDISGAFTADSASFATVLDGVMTDVDNLMLFSASATSSLEELYDRTDALQSVTGSYVTTASAQFDGNVGITGSLSVSQSVEIIGDITSVGKILQNREQRSTFMGFEAGINEDDGNRYNVGLGYRALCNLNDGTRNVAIGFNAMDSLDSGDRNVGIGSWAGAGVVSGNENTYVGVCAGADMSGGTRRCNVGIGYRAAYQATVGSNNTSIGTLAGENMTSGSGNVQIGWRAGNAVTTGQNNISIGTNSDWSNICGDCNVVIGYNARNGGTIDDHVIVIGANAVGRGDHTVTIGSSIISSSRLYGTLEIDGIADVSASIAALEAGDIVLPDGTVSSSAQLASDISGALSNTAIASLGAEILSSSNGLLDLSGSISASGDLHILGQLYGDGSQLTGVSASAIQNGLLFGDGLLGGTFTGVLDVTSSIDTSSAHFITGSINALEGHTNLSLNGTISTASYVDFDNIADLPTLFSSSDQVSYSGTGLLSSSVQIADNISGSFTNTSASIASDISASLVRINSLEEATFSTDGTNILSSSAQISTEISGAFTNNSASLAQDISNLSLDFTTLTSKTLISSSAQIASDISGAFDSVSASLASDIAGISTDFDDITNKPVLYSGSTQLVNALDGQDITLGRVNASEIVTEIVSSSISFSTGSNIFGDELTDNHEFTGSVLVTGSVHISDSLFAPTVTGSLLRLSENGQGMRLTNVGGFENFSGTFNIFSNNDIFLRAGGTGDSFAVATLYQSNQRAEFHGQVSASLFSGSFVGDGSELTGITADSVTFDNVTNKPTLVSSSNQLEGFVSQSADFVANEFIVANGANSVTSSNLLSVDMNEQRIGIGTSSPTVKLDIVGNTGGEAQMRLAQHDDSTDGPDMRFFKSRGTEDSPSAVNANDYIGAVNAFSYDGSNYQQSGFFGFQSQGTGGDARFSIKTRLDGAFPDRLSIDGDGNINISNNLNVTGSITGSSFSGSFIGDGSGLTGITADGTLSGSSQIASDISGAFDSVSASLATDISNITNGDITITSASNALTASIAQALEMENVDVVDQQFTFALINTASRSVVSYDTNDLLFNPSSGELEITGLTVTNFTISGSNIGQGTIQDALTSSLAINATQAISAETASLADEIVITTMPAMVNTYYPTLTTSTSDRGIVIATSSIYYDRPNETLYVPNFSGSFTGNIETATTASFVAASAVTNVTTYRETVSGATSYVITHNLNEQYPIVQAWNTSNNQMEIPASITSDSVNQVTVDFGLTFTGQIVIKI